VLLLPNELSLGHMTDDLAGYNPHHWPSAYANSVSGNYRIEACQRPSKARRLLYSNTFWGCRLGTSPGLSMFGRVTAPVVLVGHSYGGALITHAGVDERVAALVYIAALAPDETETSQSQQQKFPVTDVFSHIEVADGRIWLKPSGIQHFAGDLPDTEQRPLVGSTCCRCPAPRERELRSCAIRAAFESRVSRFRRLSSANSFRKPDEGAQIFRTRSRWNTALSKDVRGSSRASPANSSMRK
jgi:pimeloyl-ACP methyl ester carboxylesterase